MTTAEPTRIQRLHTGLLKFCKHPASILVWFCLLSLIVKEQYPFSNFPMYSGWSSRTHYFYIADEEGPIQAKTVFKVSVPRMKKLYGGIIDDLEEELDKPYHELTDQDFATAGQRLLKNLRKGVPKKRREGQLKDHARTPQFHPDGTPLLVKDILARDLTLIRVEIQREKKQFTTEETLVVTTDANNAIITAPEVPN